MSVSSLLSHPLSYRIVPIGAKLLFLWSIVFPPHRMPAFGSEALFWPLVSVGALLLATEIPSLPRGVRLIMDMVIVLALFTKDFFDICRVIL